MNDTSHSWAQRFAQDKVDSLSESIQYPPLDVPDSCEDLEEQCDHWKQQVSELDCSGGPVDTLQVFETLCCEIHEHTSERWAKILKNEHMLVTAALAVNALFISVQTALMTLFGTSMIRVTRYCFLSPEEEARRSSFRRKYDQLLRAMGSMSDNRCKLAAIEEFGLRKFQDLQEQAWQKSNKKSDQ